MMTRPHVLIIEGSPFYAEMFHFRFLNAPGAGRVSTIQSWGKWRELEEAVQAVFTRAENLPEDWKPPEQVLNRSSPLNLVVLDKIPPVEVEGCEVTCMSQHVDLKDVLIALGLHASQDNVNGTLEGKPLAEKESLVVCRTVNGYSLKEVADELECTVSTVQSYKRRAMEKLGATHLSDLSVTAAARGMRDCPCRKYAS